MIEDQNSNSHHRKSRRQRPLRTSGLVEDVMYDDLALGCSLQKAGFLGDSPMGSFIEESSMPVAMVIYFLLSLYQPIFYLSCEKDRTQCMQIM